MPKADLRLAGMLIGYFLADNRLPRRVLRIQQDELEAEVMVLLADEETLTVPCNPQGVADMGMNPGQDLWVIFNSNSPYVGP
ncbi:TOBE domain-containing protein [Methylomonas sp. SURF-2]|uniref:TOBE domain-containing protein n=1 Tax=Methylomonas subterranea TaxID=2952225 RepID=A0ABT1TE07_9GAMM|nr:TOBE domain-containing protein [Methylomonas sp. SURF-2]MCQ8103691.1 TOBE domain-containing protein [Methylomonas sp. SURF-2]